MGHIQLWRMLWPCFEDDDQPSDLGVRYGNMAWHFLGNLWLPSLNPTAADGFPVKVHGFPGFSIAALEFIKGKQMVIWISLLHFIVFCGSGWCLSVHMKVNVFFYSRNIY